MMVKCKVLRTHIHPDNNETVRRGQVYQYSERFADEHGHLVKRLDRYPENKMRTPDYHNKYECEYCGKDFASPQGLGGHKRHCPERESGEE